MSRRNGWEDRENFIYARVNCSVCHQFINTEDKTNRTVCERCDEMAEASAFLSELIAKEGRELFLKRMAWIDQQMAKEEDKL